MVPKNINIIDLIIGDNRVAIWCWFVPVGRLTSAGWHFDFGLELAQIEIEQLEMNEFGIKLQNAGGFEMKEKTQHLYTFLVSRKKDSCLLLLHVEPELTESERKYNYQTMTLLLVFMFSLYLLFAFALLYFIYSV